MQGMEERLDSKADTASPGDRNGRAEEAESYAQRAERNYKQAQREAEL